MFAARLSTALEDRAFGEHETDKILEHREVQRALERLRKEPRCRNEVLPPTGWEPKELPEWRPPTEDHCAQRLTPRVAGFGRIVAGGHLRIRFQALGE